MERPFRTAASAQYRHIYGRGLWHHRGTEAKVKWPEDVWWNVQVFQSSTHLTAFLTPLWMDTRVTALRSLPFTFRREVALDFFCTKCEILKKSKGRRFEFFLLTQVLEQAAIFFFLSYIKFVSLKQIKARPISKEMKLKSKKKEEIGRIIWFMGVGELRKTKMGTNQKYLCLKKFKKSWKKFISYKIFNNFILIC